MPNVIALYRYPLKGFTAEPCESLRVLENGRIAGDRILGFRFANSAAVNDNWSKKNEMLALVNTPGLAHLQCQFDHKSLRLCLSLDGQVLIEAGLDAASRRRIAAVVEEYVVDLDENPLAPNPERRPLKLVGDGITPRFQDSEAGQVTLHSRASLEAVAAAVAEPNLSEFRFRSNIVIEGLFAWEEQDWLGRKVRIGEVCFEVVDSKTRCLATHANPLTGERDLPILTTLKQHFKQKKPTFAVAMLTNGIGGQIHRGDPVCLID